MAVGVTDSSRAASLKLPRREADSNARNAVQDKAARLDMTLR